MSNFSNLIIFAACFGAGFFIEPKIFRNGSLFDADTPKPAAETTATEQATSTEAPALNINMDLSKVLPEDFPKKVTLLKPLVITDEISGVSMNLAQGAFVKPIKVNGDNLVIQPIGIPIESEIPADDTNFKQLVIPAMLARLQNASDNPAPAAEVPATPSEAPATPAPPAEPEVTPAPVVSETPAPPAETQPAGSTPAASTGLTEEQIIAKIKESILAGGVKEFVPEQITEMKKGTPAEVDGVVYEETGHVTFVAQTILGEQKHGAIALFRNGAVEKWVWAKNMLEMR